MVTEWGADQSTRGLIREGLRLLKLFARNPQRLVDFKIIDSRQKP